MWMTLSKQADRGRGVINMKQVLGYIIAALIGAAGAVYGPDAYRAATDQPDVEVTE